jgi:hypothetical protein
MTDALTEWQKAVLDGEQTQFRKRLEFSLQQARTFRHLRLEREFEEAWRERLAKSFPKYEIQYLTFWEVQALHYQNFGLWIVDPSSP